GTTAGTVFSGTVTIPLTATPGATRMRVSCLDNAIPAADKACGTVDDGVDFGELEDYQVVTMPASTVTYTWSPSDGLSATTGFSVTATPTTSGPVTYTVTGINGNGCTSSADVVLQVNAIPVATATNDGPLCEGGLLNF